EEAIAQLESALVHAPGLVDAHYHLAGALVEVGRSAEARAALESAVRLAPQRADFHLALAQAGRLTSGHPRLAAMEDLAQDMASLPEQQQMFLHYALGKAFADLAQAERSFQHLVAGNALKRRRIAYGEAAALGLIERIRAVFTADLMRGGRGGDPSPIPVFIVGFPRSGASLIEQTLAAHSAVHSAGHHGDLGRIVAGIGGSSAPAFPEVVPLLPGAAFAQIAASYLGGIRAPARRAQRIVDKMTGNFLLVGLIHLALPNARIIHARRDPIDTCVSCFATLFANGEPYSYDLDELGRYYVAYQALMAHWRAVLPRGLMLEVDYEDVVDNPAGQARRLVAHCGLDWEDACIAFGQTRRPAQGASIHHLRRPIYRTSVGRGHGYRALLQPLIAALGSGRDPGDDDLIA
ncbi:MAG TPA: sulfotransferase, partial [Xanthobacteraceae bacterium]|nr:sulfotransferase [Xanthobacteraceae bacterium]